MDDKKLEQLLNEMNNSYDRIPELTNKEDIMTEVSMKKKQPIWKKLMPFAAGAAGLVLFIIMTLSSIDPMNNSKSGNQGDQGNDEQQEEENNVGDEDNEQNDIDIEKEKRAHRLEQHFTEKKEEFQHKLGIDNIDSFWEVASIKEMIDAMEEHQISESEMMNFIDDSFTIPSEKVEDIYQITAEDVKDPFYVDSEIQQFIYKMSSFYSSAQHTLNVMLNQHKLGLEGEYDLLELQDTPEKYNGPDELKGFLSMLNGQGLKLVMDKDPDFLRVALDENWITNQMATWNIDDTYKRAVKLLTTYHTSIVHDSVGFGSYDGIVDDLLEMEDILINYTNDTNDTLNPLPIEYNLYFAASEYINRFIIGEGQDIYLSDKSQEELKSFLVSHPNSRFWSIIDTVVQEYEETSWDKGDNFYRVTDTEVRILFEEKWEDIEYKDIIRLDLPLVNNGQELFDGYQREQNPINLTDLSAFEAMALYLYSAYERNSDIVHSLLTQDSEWQGEDKLYHALETNVYHLLHNPDYIIQEWADNQQVTYYFITRANMMNVIGGIEMKKENGVWKVHALIQN
ncbi:hypothetical protein [Ornithinibacillus halophilus]|uniref:Uncharacterized protein n=1 Tax=Ornithinibacillus halophilus TaxID=930117 RepID=A0A1M5ND41_9BACI|nr:hypothetical protein [Ornithinibacillus halophilus]SHG87421.1 hypothetical protein SAMN05216225_107612 [Ornithinibacillus halophilus]